MVPEHTVNPWEAHIDDLQCIFNRVIVGDLEWVLRLTQPNRRRAVLMAFTGLTQDRWAREAGLGFASVSRWFSGDHNLPFGAACRLSIVVGMNPILLFEDLTKRPTKFAPRPWGRGKQPDNLLDGP